MAHDTSTAKPISTPPSHEKLLVDLFEFNFNIQELIRFHDLTPAQFLAFSEDKTVRRTLDAFEAFQQREQRILARQAQSSAAGHLNQSIMDAPNSIEARRAATALARLTSQMQPRPPRTTARSRSLSSREQRAGSAETKRTESSLEGARNNPEGRSSPSPHQVMRPLPARNRPNSPIAC